MAKKKKYRLRKKRIGAFLLLLVLLFVGGAWGVGSIGKGLSNWQEGRNVYSTAALVLDVEQGKVVYQKHANKVYYPASLTKLVTVYVVLLTQPDLDERITITNEMLAGLYEAEASVTGFQVGERVGIRDLLYSTMLTSGADATRALMLATYGSEEAFVRRMNDLAKDLGMKHSHFTNGIGLHDPDHVMSASDLGRFLQKALQNDTFYDLMTTLQYRMAPTNRHSQGRLLSHTMQTYFGDELNRQTFHLLGGKSGYTSEAGLCLVSLAESEGRHLAVVTLGAPGDQSNHLPLWRDTCYLYALYFK